MVLDTSELAAGMANLALRALHHQVRQATTDSATATPTSLSAAPTSSSISLAPTASPTSSDTSNGNGSGNGNGNGSGSGSSPLLFFVALGFGVVFTNLW